MNAYYTLPDAVTEIFGEEATAERAYDLLTVDVPVGSWIAALEIARDKLGCTYFDWLSAVDEPGTGFRVCAHVAALEAGAVRRLLVRTTVPHASPSLPTAVEVYAGAAWHERETHEMFGVEFTGHPNLVPLLLPENFEGHPLRKDFVLAARVVKAWPGAKEPGESEHGGPKRRQMLPPGVPDPNEWGPLKGQLPPAPTRPTRASGAAAADRPVRRARTTAEGSASQAAETAPAARRARTAAEGSASQAEETAPAARRARTAAEGSASQTAAPARPGAGADAGAGSAPEAAAAAPARRAGEETTTPAAEAKATAGPAPDAPGAGAGSAPVRSAGEGGSAVQRADESAAEAEGPSDQDQGATPRPPRRSRSAADGSASQAGAPVGPARSPRTRSSDAPWHHARPAFEDESAAAEPVPDTAPAPDAAPDAEDPTDTPPTPPTPPTHPAGGDPA